MGDEFSDARADYVGRWFTNSLKIKEDRWKKIINDEEARQVCVHVFLFMHLCVRPPPHHVWRHHSWLCQICSCFFVHRCHVSGPSAASPLLQNQQFFLLHACLGSCISGPDRAVSPRGRRYDGIGRIAAHTTESATAPPSSVGRPVLSLEHYRSTASSLLHLRHWPPLPRIHFRHSCFRASPSLPTLPWTLP